MPEPKPIKNDNPAIWDIVINEMKDRDNLGLCRYGMRLQANNGRDALQDLKEELLDGIAYLIQVQQEMKTEYVVQSNWGVWEDLKFFLTKHEMQGYLSGLDYESTYRMIERKTLVIEKEIEGDVKREYKCADCAMDASYRCPTSGEYLCYNCMEKDSNKTGISMQDYIVIGEK